MGIDRLIATGIRDLTLHIHIIYIASFIYHTTKVFTIAANAVYV